MTLLEKRYDIDVAVGDHTSLTRDTHIHAASVGANTVQYSSYVVGGCRIRRTRSKIAGVTRGASD